MRCPACQRLMPQAMAGRSTAELTAQKLAFGVFTRRLLALGTALPFGRLVRALGIGPRTSVLSGQRSTTELCPQMSQYHSRI